MTTETPAAQPSKALLWTGRIIGGIPALMLAMAGATQVAKTQQTVEGTAQYGYPESMLVPLGIVTLVSVLLYFIPRTAIFGAILLTGYLGGAVATHVRAGDPVFNVFFPVIFGSLLWLGLVFRDVRLRKIMFE